MELLASRGATFARITYTNAHGEHYRETLVLGVDYGRCLRDNAETLAPLVSWVTGQGSVDALAFYRADVQRRAAFELFASNCDSLSGKGNALDVHAEAGTFGPMVVDGVTVRGGKVHNVTGEKYVDGLSVSGSRVVIVVGEYPPDKRRELTVAKDVIRATLATSRYRRYRFDAMTRIAMRGEMLVVGEGEGESTAADMVAAGVIGGAVAVTV